MKCYLVVGFPEFGGTNIYGLYSSSEAAAERALVVNSDEQIGAVCVVVSADLDAPCAVSCG